VQKTKLPTVLRRKLKEGRNDDEGGKLTTQVGVSAFSCQDHRGRGQQTLQFIVVGRTTAKMRMIVGVGAA